MTDIDGLTDNAEIYSTVITSSQRTHEFFIVDSIDEFKDYLPLIQTLRTAEPNDKVFIHLSTPGGSIDIGVAIINAMDACLGEVHTIMTGTVASLGALIFLSGQVTHVEPFGLLMMHNYSSGHYGKGHEIESAHIATDAWIKELYEQVCIPFISTKELNAIFSGQDMYFTSDETTKRLNKREKQLLKDI